MLDWSRAARPGPALRTRPGPPGDELLESARTQVFLARALEALEHLVAVERQADAIAHALDAPATKTCRTAVVGIDEIRDHRRRGVSVSWSMSTDQVGLVARLERADPVPRGAAPARRRSTAAERASSAETQFASATGSPLPSSQCPTCPGRCSRPVDAEPGNDLLRERRAPTCPLRVRHWLCETPVPCSAEAGSPRRRPSTCPNRLRGPRQPSFPSRRRCPNRDGPARRQRWSPRRRASARA